MQLPAMQLSLYTIIIFICLFYLFNFYEDDTMSHTKAPLNLTVNYVSVMKYTCIYQISYKTEIFKAFDSMHFYLDLLLIK